MGGRRILMSKSSDKKSAFGLSGEQIERLLSIGYGKSPDVAEPLSSSNASDRERTHSKVEGSEPTPQIDGYEVIEKVAEAGQGQVWRALQHSTGRVVAIKVPRLGKVTSERARVRFEREIELAARLKHPNIARIYDSGVDRGQYYYVMDFVEGLNLNEYVRQHGLTHRQILELMRTICQAVQHAHQNGIIHRDLKPSNIIVTDSGRPFIIDFGLAKGFSEDDRNLVVSVDGETLGTPAYMSPEQAAGHTDKVDTRTDVYSLGVTLFTLLTGSNPHDLSGTRLEVMHRIAEKEVMRPRILNRKIDKDIEALLLKSLERDPDRRYSSAAGLADDIDNYLKGEPLIAGSQSNMYRLTKFLKRNKLLVTSVAVVLVMLVTGIMVSTIFAIGQARARAEAQAVSDFLLFSVLESLDHYKVGGRQITTRFVLDAVAKDLQDKFKETPMIEAEIRQAIGFAYWSLGSYELAELHQRRAVDICRAQLGNKDPKTLLWVKELGWVYHSQSRFKEAEKLFSEAYEGMQRELGEEDPNTLHAMASLGAEYYIQGRFEEAEQLCRKALETVRRVRGEEHTGAYYQMLARGYHLQGHYKEAEQLFIKAIDVSSRKHGEKGWHTLLARLQFGELCLDLGRYKEAERDLLYVLNVWCDVWGQEHPMTLWTKTYLGWLYHSQGRYKEAEELLSSTLKTACQTLGETHLLSMHAMHGLGTLYLSQGQYDKAERLLKKASEIGIHILGEENWATLQVSNTLAKLYKAQGRYEEAEKTFHKILEARKLKLGEDHPDTLQTKNDWAMLYKEQTRYEEAERYFLEALDGRRLKLGDQHPHTIESIRGLIALYKSWNKPEEVEEWQAKLPQIEAKIE
jgi:serine/threonine protein kinase/Tfp pilus assembly protein PilF